MESVVGFPCPNFAFKRFYETMLHTHQGLGIDLNVEFGLQTIASCPPRETDGDSSLNHEVVEFRENKGLGIDSNVEFCPEAEASEVLSAASSIGDHSGTDSLTTEAIGKESRSSKVSEAIYLEAKYVNEQKKDKGKGKEKQESLDADDGGVKTEPPFQEGEEKHKFSGLILLSEAVEMQKLKAPTNVKESDAAVAAKGKRSIKSSSSKRSSESSGEDCLHGDLEDTSPVVRSKRGRSQVLPSRYRDSIVLTPWKRVVRSQGTAVAPMVPNK
ncbi:hypothetical protein P3X46_016772 [Hevea brasiliensis]|uniref:Uncharacterized protein n=1 Tax=Hevea brasiliensis TaxID=3981 RepID=A0ABQ9M1D4_HEVBR|nr:hypothetical protein P3X46_016772 [Hevea brasiliensis]